MNVYAFVLVLLTLAVCVVVIVHQGVENRGLRADLRRVNDRLLNALVAENAVEMNGLDKSTVTDLSPEAADFLARERREARAEARRGGLAPVGDRPPGGVVGMT